MTKPDKPLEAQGLGCGLIISLVAMTTFLIWLGLSPTVAIWMSVILAAVSLIAYMVNQYKSQRILDAEYKALITRPPSVASGKSQSSIFDNEHGNYMVVGIDKATGMDTTWYTSAASAANAKVKGELQGIIVTAVTKL